MKGLVNVLGKLSWGTTVCAVFVVCAATAITLPAQVTTLFTFDGTHGASPYAGLVQATDGDLSTEQRGVAGPKTPALSSKSPPLAS